MSKTSRSEAAKSSFSDLSYEQAVQKLETILDSIEQEELPLESLTAKFQEASGLLACCQGKLSEAETRIQALEKQTGGQFAMKPADSNLQPD